jgi:hypothetical protein
VSLERGDAPVEGVELRGLSLACDVLSQSTELSDDERHVTVDLLEALVDLLEALADFVAELLELRPADAAFEGFEHDLHVAERLLEEDHGAVLLVTLGRRRNGRNRRRGRDRHLPRTGRSAARGHGEPGSKARPLLQETAGPCVGEGSTEVEFGMVVERARTVPGDRDEIPRILGGWSLSGTVRGVARTAATRRERRPEEVRSAVVDSTRNHGRLLLLREASDEPG